MEIGDIKSRLDIVEVAKELGIEVDGKTKRALCPFHAEKTPSFQFSTAKQIVTCFSAACGVGTMDVIGLTEKKLGISKHEALTYLSELAGNLPEKPKQIQTEAINYSEVFTQMQSSYISSSTAKEYAKGRELDSTVVAMGYNALKNSKFPLLRGCLTFGLQNASGDITSLYGRSVSKSAKSKHFYTANRSGLFPSYPKAGTTKLILTESVIDAATLLSIPKLKEQYSVLALYGTNGLNTEHLKAIQSLNHLTEIIFWFDGDAAGKTAVQEHYNTLFNQFPKLTLSKVDCPDGEDLNSLVCNHRESKTELVFAMLKQREILNRDFFLSEEILSIEESNSKGSISTENSIEIKKGSGLNTSNPNSLHYSTETAEYTIKGGIRKELDSLKVTLVIATKEHPSKSRSKLDLYEDKQMEKVAREAAEKLDVRADLIELDLQRLTDLLDDYREELLAMQDNTNQEKITLTASERKTCETFLQHPNLFEQINQTIGAAGVVGEDQNRLFLFGIAASYKMPDTLHALIQGSSGSGKTHLLATIMDFMPPEDTISLTRVTESSFYNYGKFELQHKLIGMEDYDGLEEKAELAFRELQSKGMISSSTSGKNEQTGEIAGFVKEVYGPIASMSATTQGEIYEDNMSRCFLVAVDESREQTQRIIQYQNAKAAGKIDSDTEQEKRTFLRNCIRCLEPYQVINPFADQIHLPEQAHKIRRLNELFQAYVKQVTLLHQFQRRKDEKGRLISEKQDVALAIESMFESIVLKVDELDGSLRAFYEELKAYVKQRGKEYEFSRLEIRQAFGMSKTQQHKYFQHLLDYEYIQQISGYANRGYKYRILYWDNNVRLRTEIREALQTQIDKL